VPICAQTIGQSNLPKESRCQRRGRGPKSTISNHAFDADVRRPQNEVAKFRHHFLSILLFTTKERGFGFYQRVCNSSITRSSDVFMTLTLTLLVFFTHCYDVIHFQSSRDDVS
jgi:hypothetical protein